MRQELRKEKGGDTGGLRRGSGEQSGVAGGQERERGKKIYGYRL